VSAVNTTLAVVATNAALDPAQARRTATAAHDGIGRALSPAHTLFDGDTVFTLSTGAIPVDLAGLFAVQAAAADAVLLAILDAVLATPAFTSDHPNGISAAAYAP
jgi:L-aminopeptidase/D-esterase-like protein